MILQPLVDKTFILSSENKLQLLIPNCFAHGFLVLSDKATFSYKVDNHYNSEFEDGIIWNDSLLNIQWPIPISDIKVSEKDNNQPTLSFDKNIFSKNLLIIGETSQLGKEIKNLSKKYSESNFFFTDSSVLDVIDKDLIDAFFHKHHIDLVINCSAYTAVDNAEVDQDIAYQVNGKGVKNLLDVCELHNTVIIHISTDYVFDGSKNKPYSELDFVNPLNVYGRSKRMGEEYLLEAKVQCFIIRTSWLYSSHGRNFC